LIFLIMIEAQKRFGLGERDRLGWRWIKVSQHERVSVVSERGKEKPAVEAGLELVFKMRMADSASYAALSKDR